MNFEIEKIKDLVKILNDNNLTELTLEDSKGGGNKSITIKKRVSYLKEISVEPQNLTIKQNNEVNNEVKDIPKGTPITSPMVGTFYASPSPDKEPYVSVGDEIKAGDTVCIIEAMKLLNEIETDISGRVVEICVENGQTIEFGQTLMYVE